jgi:hypothetical protein
MQLSDGPRIFDHDPAVRREVTQADDSAHSPLATDQNRLYVAAVLVGYQIGDEARSTREVDEIDIVAGIVEEVPNRPDALLEMWCQQREVVGPKPTKQVIAGSRIGALLSLHVQVPQISSTTAATSKTKETNGVLCSQVNR